MSRVHERPFPVVQPGAVAGIVLAALLTAAAGAAAPAPPTSRQVVEFLASDALEGRLTGTPGELAAAEYLAARLEELGARPLPGHDGYLLPFEFTAGTHDAGSTLELRGMGETPLELAGAEVVQALSFSDSATVSGPVVFAGYGIVVPDGQGFPYDSYAGLDVTDKVVVVLRYFPEDSEGDARKVLSRYSGLRYKAMQARQRGAAALVVVAGPRSPNAGETVPMSFDTAISGSGIVAVSLGGDAAAHLFAAVGKDLETVQAALDDANPHVAGFPLPGVGATVAAAVARERRTGHSVAGYLPADGEPAAERPWVVLGAHLDHLGRGQSGNSLARKEEAGGIHHGADDDASGVAAVLAAGRGLAAFEGRRRRVALVFFSGEELGLLGSSAFVDAPVLPPEQIAGYLNFDMVGRLGDEPVALEAVASSAAWPGLIERANVPVGLDVVLSDDPYLPQDSTSFNRVKVPTLAFFTGSHEDYHRPSDTADKIDYAGLERIARLGALVGRALAVQESPPEFVEVAPSHPQGGGGDTRRAFTGTIPDYTAEVEGMRLSGVVGGGPADQAGLREGDVIVELAGQTIANVYDYTYALDAVKIGEPAKVVFVRDGERHEVTLTPRARD